MLCDTIEKKLICLTYIIYISSSNLQHQINTDDLAFGYTDGCDGFHEKSKKIFDASVKGSVLHQLCDDENPFGHLNHVPVDCNKGVVVNGWSQGSHVASLAGNYAPSLITAGLFWANGKFLLFPL